MCIGYSISVFYKTGEYSCTVKVALVTRSLSYIVAHFVGI